MINPEDYPYCIDCHISNNDEPDAQTGAHNLADAIAQADLLWAARAVNGFTQIVVYHDAGDSWNEVYTPSDPDE